MKNFYHQTSRSTIVPALTLTGIWDVNADSSYQVFRNDSRSSQIVIVRTMAGVGELSDDCGETVRLDPDTLFCVEQSRIRQYRTFEENWLFWWFIVNVAGPLPFPLNTPMRIPRQNTEAQDFRDVCALIKSSRHERRAYGMARFSVMLYRWLVAWGGIRRQGVYDEQLDRLITRLRESPGGDWTVESMAHACNLSIRRFRDVFTRYTGLTPKRFYDKLRLEQGRQLLRMGLCNVNEAALKLGYSSAFHFSRAYKMEFGEPPTASM